MQLSFTLALLCGMALAVDTITDEVQFKNIYHNNGPTLLPNDFGAGEMLKSGGQIAWDITSEGEGESLKDVLKMYQTIGVNIDQLYGLIAEDSADEDSEDEDDKIVESPADAVIQVGLCAPTNEEEEVDRIMMCSLIEFDKAEKEVYVRNWQKKGDVTYPAIDWTKPLSDSLWTGVYDTEVGDGNSQDDITHNANYKIAEDKTVTKVVEKDYRFGIVSSDVKTDWNDMLKATFYQQQEKDDNSDASIKKFFDDVKDGNIVWNGRQYLSVHSKSKLDGGNDADAVQMAITSVEYGVAGEGKTVGSDSWTKDTVEACSGAVGMIAASFGSFALALAVMNF